MKRDWTRVLAMLATGILMTPLTLIFAAPQTMTGEASVGNAAPTVDSVAIEDGGSPVTNMDVNTEYNVTIGVSDANTLDDLKNLTVYIYGPSSSEGASDSVTEHYTFVWTSAGGWDEVGPDGGGNSHLGANSDSPTLTGTSGTFHLEFILSKVAEDTESTSWTAKVYAYDDADASGNNQDTAGMNFYVELSLNATAVGWSGSPNTDDVSPNVTVRATSITNDNYDMQVKGDDLTKGGDTIEVGNVTVDDDDTASEGSETGGVEQALTTSYADWLVNQAGQNESGETDDMWYFLDIPNVVPGTYSGTLYVNFVDVNTSP